MNTSEARRVAPFTGVIETSGDKPSVLAVPGHDGRTYNVRLHRARRLTYWCGCQGATRGVCYHGMAAVIRAAQEGGYCVSWTGKGDDGRAKAHRLVNLGGQVLSLTSERSRVSAWAVVKSHTRIQIETVPMTTRALGRKLYGHASKNGLVIFFSTVYGEVMIGDNTYEDVRRPSWNRMKRLMTRLYQEGKVTPGWVQGGLGYQITCA